MHIAENFDADTEKVTDLHQERWHVIGSSTDEHRGNARILSILTVVKYSIINHVCNTDQFAVICRLMIPKHSSLFDGWRQNTDWLTNFAYALINPKEN